MEALDLGNVRRHFHHRRQIAVLVVHRRGIGYHSRRGAVTLDHRGLHTAHLAVLQCLLGVTVRAGRTAILEYLIAVLAYGIAEFAAEFLVGPNNPQILVLDVDIARYPLKEILVLLAAGLDLGVELLDLGYVGGHLHNAHDRAVFVLDRRRVYDHMRRATVFGNYGFLGRVRLAVLEGLQYRAIGTDLRRTLVDHMAFLTHAVAEVITEGAVGTDDAQVAVLNRQVTRYLLEEPVNSGIVQGRT